MLSEDELNAIKERTSCATPGPWETTEDGYGIITSYEREWDDTNPACQGHIISPLQGILEDHDAEFIAHAREDISDLLAEVDRLNEEHEGNMDALQGWYDNYQELEQENERLKQDLDKTAKHCAFLNDETFNAVETSKMWQEKAVQLNKEKLILHQDKLTLSRMTVNNTKEYERLHKALVQIVNTVGQWSWEDAIKVARQALEGAK